ncbi:nucleotide-binding alpha-beta plait domain-containing protein, partial [Tanacetum coccineum]
MFVTNFLDLFNAKDLWNTCKQYGNVVDAYIPNKRSKAGKRFSFVCFIKIFDVEHLVKNLCTVWVGRKKLHANVARFLREPLTKKSNQFNTYGDNRHNIEVDVKNRGVKGYSNSYAHIVKGSQSSHTKMENKPALVLDNSCLNQHDYSNFLMGKVKDFVSLSNLKVVLEETKQMFQSSVGISSWFSQLKQASNDFIIDGRVTWVEIEGIPLKMWSENAFNRIASIWGTLLHVKDQEDACKVFWVRAKEIPGWVSDFMEDVNEEYDMDDATNGEESNGEDDELHKINSENGYVGQNKANSEDPFNLYDLLNKKKDENNKGDCVEDSLKFPSGFTPKDTNEVTEECPNTSNESKRVSREGVHSFQEEDTVFGVKKHGSKKKAKDDVVESMCSRHFQKAKT